MDDKKMLNNEELEKVVGGTSAIEPNLNLYEKAIENAIQKIIDAKQTEMCPSDIPRLIKIYEKMLNIFNSCPLTSEAINLAIQSLDSIPDTYGRPQEIIDDFKREVQC